MSYSSAGPYENIPLDAHAYYARKIIENHKAAVYGSAEKDPIRNQHRTLKPKLDREGATIDKPVGIIGAGKT